MTHAKETALHRSAFHRSASGGSTDPARIPPTTTPAPAIENTIAMPITPYCITTQTEWVALAALDIVGRRTIIELPMPLRLPVPATPAASPAGTCDCARSAA